MNFFLNLYGYGIGLEKTIFSKASVLDFLPQNDFDIVLTY